MKINVSAIVTYKKTVLLMQRSLTDDYYAGAWGIPGGYLEDVDNSLEDAVRREVLEELGLHVIPNQIIANNINRDTDTLYVVYSAALDEEQSTTKSVVLSDEANDYKWATLVDIETLEFTPYTKERIIQTLEKLNA